ETLLSSQPPTFALSVANPPMHVINLHRLLYHAGESGIRRTAKEQGIPVRGSLFKAHKCVGCSRVKIRRWAIPRSTETRASTPYSQIFVDLTGPKPRTHGGNTYAMIIVDDTSRYAGISLLKKKNDAVGALQKWHKSTVIPAGVKVDFVRHDPGGEFQGGAFEELLQEMGARSEETNTGTPQQNGVAERRLALIDEGARASLYSAGLGGKLWL
ncbi:unnamed protein product, partial [Discosporangium mesarthrocarpum]